jgi:hypothetical protein
MVRDFRSLIIGNSNDAYNGLWVMWHVKEALQGNQPFFALPLLYYPSGATLLTHIPGPLTGLFALPFWLLGTPQAAHNGAVLVTFILTGYFMYLLARGLGFGRFIAFFAGALLLVAPMHVAGLWGHTTKVFLGVTPLALLGLHHTLALERSRRQAIAWAAGAALALLLTLLHDSFQFIVTGMGMAFFILAAFWSAPRAQWSLLLKRLLWLAVAGAVIVGPLFLATVLAAADPTLDFDRNFDSYTFQPDLLEFLVPPAHSLVLGPAVTRFLAQRHVGQGMETAVSLSWVGLALSGLALARGPRAARLWLLFTLIWVILSLGPSLKVAGDLEFTEYNLPIILPYAYLTALPGLDFLRTPGRFMQIGFVGLAITAAYGLAWPTRRYPRGAAAIPLLALGLLFLEQWPRPWPLIAIRPAPAFYQHIALDEDAYGVLDLPFTPTPEMAAIVYGAHYQMYQMAHKKGIAMGYISRTYDIHPVFPCFIPQLDTTPDITINGRPNQCYRNALYDLAQANYRYVVWHKPQAGYGDYTPGSWGESQAAGFVDLIFSDQRPLSEDDLAVVYAVPPEDASSLTTAITLKHNWYRIDSDGTSHLRWARSPATLWIASPRRQQATLELRPFLLYEPGPAGQYIGQRGTLAVTTENGATSTIEINSEETARIPLTLEPGINPVTLSLQAGNFQPAAYEGNDRRWLSFAIRAINLQTE